MLSSRACKRQPELELNYVHGFNARESDVDSLAGVVGYIVSLPQDVRLDLGFRHTIYGRNVELGLGVIANVSVTF